MYPISSNEFCIKNILSGHDSIKIRVKWKNAVQKCLNANYYKHAGNECLLQIWKKQP